LSLDAWLGQTFGSIQYGGMTYPLLASSSMGVNPQKEPPNDPLAYMGYLQQAYRSNGLIFACMLARMLHFSEARFAFQELNDGRPGSLFYGPGLDSLENPWPNGYTGDLLARAINDVDLAGNFYLARDGAYLRRLKPEWTTIILGSNSNMERPVYAWDTDILGYYYCPPQDPSQEKSFLAADVAHWAPIPDPYAKFRGMSWLTPAIRDVIADDAMTTHQRKYFEQGATSNLVVSFDPGVSPEAYERWMERLGGQAEGMMNAYKIIWLGGGATPTTIGNGLEEFRVVRGHGETRVAAAAGVPPIIVGLSEGLDSATYSNYAQARRHFGDSTLRWLWRTLAQSLATVTAVPQKSRLWYDLRDVAFMRQDEADAAAIMQQESTTIRTLVDGGWKPDTVKAAVLARDWTLLEHSGLLSVQLQPPGTTFSENKNQPALPAPAGQAQLVIPTPAQRLELERQARVMLEQIGRNGHASH
jgi:hypothetical protein